MLLKYLLSRHLDSFVAIPPIHSFLCQMIHHLDNLLRHVMLTQIASLNSVNQVGFQPPDEQWRRAIANLQELALNIYLVELRENRQLRSNERVRITNPDTGVVIEETAPARLDCHYLLTAWSPVQPEGGMEPTLDEHALLYQATSVLMNTNPLNPSALYPTDSAALNAWPEPFRDINLPMTIVPVEGFMKLSEFWHSLGQGAYWKPAVYLIVTLPVVLLKILAGPIVTSRVTEYRSAGQAEPSEVWIQHIGGFVLDTLDPLPSGLPAPVPNAWVQLETDIGRVIHTTTTDNLGRFVFRHLQPGSYQLRWRAAAYPDPPPRSIQIPSATGEYDLRFE